MRIKEITMRKFILIGLVVITLNGCTFIVKDDHATKYYGIDEQRGSEYLNQILEKQQLVYQSEENKRDTKKP